MSYLYVCTTWAARGLDFAINGYHSEMAKHATDRISPPPLEAFFFLFPTSIARQPERAPIPNEPSPESSRTAIYIFPTPSFFLAPHCSNCCGDVRYGKSACIRVCDIVWGRLLASGEEGGLETGRYYCGAPILILSL